MSNKSLLACNHLCGDHHKLFISVTHTYCRPHRRFRLSAADCCFEKAFKYGDAADGQGRGELGQRWRCCPHT
jgi:hypothetical protein